METWQHKIMLIYNRRFISGCLNARFSAIKLPLQCINIMDSSNNKLFAALSACAEKLLRKLGTLLQAAKRKQGFM